MYTGINQCAYKLGKLIYIEKKTVVDGEWIKLVSGLQCVISEVMLFLFTCALLRWRGWQGPWSVSPHILNHISYRLFSQCPGVLLGGEKQWKQWLFLTSGEAPLLMVLRLLSTQAVKKYCFLPNNPARAVVIPLSQPASTVYFISRAHSLGNFLILPFSKLN